MNKGEFVKAMADKAHLTIKEAGVAYDAFVEVVTDTMKKGEKVQLVGFGTFVAKKKEACVRPNPQKKGETIKVAACKVPALKFGKSYKESIN